MTPLDTLDAGATEAIAALCARSVAHAPTADELAGAFWTADQPAVVRGDPAVGVVATVTGAVNDDPHEGYIRWLVVDPAHRGQGHGRALLAAAERDLREAGATRVTTGADAPYYLVPGVETTETAMLCLLERCRYHRHEANFNVTVDVANLPPDPGGAFTATAAERVEVEAWTREHWANWRPEVLRALDKGTLVLSRDDDGINGFCAYDVNRRGLVGPVGVRPSIIGRGVGVPLLVGALHRMRAAGADVIEVSWVGPLVPYARVGGVVGRTFFVYRKALK
jgi:GNAT superfamily N-acetyltransferase